MANHFQNFHALVVGVGFYINRAFSPLPATINDAEDLYKALLEHGYHPANVRLLTSEEATLRQMRDELSHLSSIQGGGSTVLIFFSGHGWRPANAADEDSHSHQGYLCLREADLLDMEGTSLSAEEFSRALCAIKAERIVVILDCCHANGTAQIKLVGSDMRWKSGLSEAVYQTLSQGGGRVIIASCKEDEQSYIRMRGDNSVFTYYFVEALRSGASSDGFIRIVDIFDKAAQEVTRAVRTLAQATGEDCRQTPILKAEVQSNFPIAFDEHRGQHGEDGAIQSPATPQPSATFINRGDNHGVQVNVGKHDGPSYTATTMNFGMGGKKSDNTQ